ncbi:hypothetical protein E2562_034930 [Oryza meyeriana var. granulata]|uniref:Uncharacterized protein n=1 Tax=Oryza meyeriana var. granulata TaxID=110450 RepID=A0A6G1F1D7_9ORYZ|nr:hypothetical protein E2562_034930 [Oryza meyeriana var. granulata]
MRRSDVVGANRGPTGPVIGLPIGLAGCSGGWAMRPGFRVGLVQLSESMKDYKQVAVLTPIQR